MLIPSINLLQSLTGFVMKVYPISHGKSGDADSSDQVVVIACTTDKHRESDDKTSNGEEVDRKKKPRLSTSESDEES